jgi:3-oxoacyl-[acyl-carrier-protein] synthase-3
LYRTALVIGAETLTRVMDYRDRGTCILFGDGAGAILLGASAEPGGGLLGLELTADPAGAYNIYQPAGGAASPASDSTIERRGHFVRMDGRETYRYATRTMASTVATALQQAGVSADEVALFVPHQANVRIIASVAKGLGIGMDRVYVNVDRYGNTSAASVPMALVEAVEAGRVKPGDVVVFVAFGAGYTSGACVVRWTADPALSARGRAVDPTVTIHRPDDWTADDPTPVELRPIFAAKEAAKAAATEAPDEVRQAVEVRA